MGLLRRSNVNWLRRKAEADAAMWEDVANEYKAEVEQLREALAEASEELDAAGCQVAASNAHRAAMRGIRDDRA